LFKIEDATEIITAKFTDCSEIFNPPVVFKITFLLYKFKVVNDISIQSIQKVIITTLLPFLAFYSFLQNAGKEDVKTFGVVFGLSAIYYFLLTTIALI